MIATSENFHQILLDVFSLLHNNFFDSRIAQSLTFEKSEIKIYNRKHREREVYFFLFYGLVEDFSKATSNELEISPNAVFCFQPGIARENKDVWIDPLYVIPATLSNGNNRNYPCMYCYLLPVENTKKEFLEFVNHNFLIVDNLSPDTLAEICAVMICSHEIRHEVQFSQDITLRESFPEQLPFVNMDRFNKFTSGMLDFYKDNTQDMDWYKEERDACITQAYVIDAWIQCKHYPMKEKLQKIREIIFS